MADKTLTIDVVDISVPAKRNINIAIINKPNPVSGFAATYDQLIYLINFPQYNITESATGKVVNGENIYTYFPEEDPSGGGGILIEKSVVENGLYAASDDNADGYKTVSVSVSNSYTAQDEGKVVSGGGLVSQSSDSATSNGIVDTTLINSLTVNVPTGGGGSEKKAVNFIDYDGTIVHSYTAAEFAVLTEFPANPSHDGLTAQGWMWSTFAKAKAYVAKYGKLDIGQKYRVTDGKTRIFIEIDEYRREPVLGLGVNGFVDIDWGDGSAHTTLTGTSVSTYVSTQPHTYPSGGEYVITLAVTGTANFLVKNSVCGLLMKDGFNANESRNYRNVIKRLFIGDNITSIQSNAFNNCSSLGSITIPDSVTTISSYAFKNCYSLRYVAIPDSIKTIPSAFYYCYSLRYATIPDSVTTIQLDAFYYCYSLRYATIPDSVTTIQSQVFDNCYALSSVTIPDSVTSIGSSVFYNCSSLGSITIPDNVTTISSSVFYNCYSLSSITIPDSVTTIQSGAFKSCTSLGRMKFEKATPPTVSNSDAFTGIPADCVFLVKSIAYLSAEHYPASSSYTYAYFGTFANGDPLPATIPDESTTNLTWYATIADLRAGTNPITVGNGKEVYAMMSTS